GGGEVRSALALEAFEKQLGRKAGRSAWQDFREANDPEAPATVSTAYKYETNSPFAKRGLALPDPGSVSFVSDGEPLEAPGTAPGSTRAGPPSRASTTTCSSATVAITRGAPPAAKRTTRTRSPRCSARTKCTTSIRASVCR